MPNRLAQETSPYLLQHAGNPVDWYPWGEEAFERARREDRPVLLSIGYSSCHWCHVMERESFEDVRVATLMNEGFVCVKVDREERPDVDQIYMRAAQAMTGRGGWPLTVFLTPAGAPYWAGTYFPPTPRGGLPSFRRVLDAALDAYRTRRDDVGRAADAVLQALQEASAPRGAEAGGEPGTEVLDRAAAALVRHYDARHGGFGDAPKFPQPVTLELLLRHHVRTGEARALEMVVRTLRAMAAGGIHDHVGGGFHRYSVDAGWLVPHFEKMLYDNALLAGVYTDAFRITGAADLRAVAVDVLEYVVADLGAPEGAFYAARDADSEGEEGRFYVWTRAEIDAVLEPAEAELVARCFDVRSPGSFEGANVLHLARDLEAAASAEGMDAPELAARLSAARAALAEARARRVAPLRDEKILLSWNGLALRALAEAGGALGRRTWVERAAAGADFLLHELRPDGRLLHTWKDGIAKVPAFLDDHAALGHALLSLHQATLDPRWLDEAGRICEEMVAGFWSEKEGVFYDTAETGERLLVRPRDPMDNATPSGTSLAVELLLRAGHLFGEARYEEIARRAVASEAPFLKELAPAFGRLLSALDRSLAAPVEIAIVGPRADPRTQDLLRAALAPFLRNRTTVGREPGDDVHGVPVLEGREARGGTPTAWVCQAYACREPTTDAETLARQLEEAGRS